MLSTATPSYIVFNKLKIMGGGFVSLGQVRLGYIGVKGSPLSWVGTSGVKHRKKLTPSFLRFKFEKHGGFSAQQTLWGKVQIILVYWVIAI